MKHHDGIGILHLGLCEDIRCRIAQQDTEQGVEKGDSDGIHKGIDGFGMRQEFLEIIERDVTVLIGEREEHDEQQGQHHENCREDGVRNRPTLSRRDKLNEFQFLICNFLI